jgi:hypothetical protein
MLKKNKMTKKGNNSGESTRDAAILLPIRIICAREPRTIIKQMTIKQPIIIT